MVLTFVGCCHPKARPDGHRGPQLDRRRMGEAWQRMRGCPLLDNHDTNRRVGMVLDAWVDGEQQLWIRAQIDESSAEGQYAAALIRAGEYRGLSLGMRHGVATSCVSKDGIDHDPLQASPELRNEDPAWTQVDHVIWSDVCEVSVCPEGKYDNTVIATWFSKTGQPHPPAGSTAHDAPFAGESVLFLATSDAPEGDHAKKTEPLPNTTTTTNTRHTAFYRLSITTKDSDRAPLPVPSLSSGQPPPASDSVRHTSVFSFRSTPRSAPINSSPATTTPVVVVMNTNTAASAPPPSGAVATSGGGHPASAPQTTAASPTGAPAATGALPPRDEAGRFTTAGAAAAATAKSASPSGSLETGAAVAPGGADSKSAAAAAAAPGAPTDATGTAAGDGADAGHRLAMSALEVVKLKQELAQRDAALATQNKLLDVYSETAQHHLGTKDPQKLIELTRDLRDKRVRETHNKAQELLPMVQELRNLADTPESRAQLDVIMQNTKDLVGAKTGLVNDDARLNDVLAATEVLTAAKRLQDQRVAAEHERVVAAESAKAALEQQLAKERAERETQQRQTALLQRQVELLAQTPAGRAAGLAGYMNGQLALESQASAAASPSTGSYLPTAAPRTSVFGSLLHSTASAVDSAGTGGLKRSAADAGFGMQAGQVATGTDPLGAATTTTTTTTTLMSQASRSVRPRYATGEYADNGKRMGTIRGAFGAPLETDEERQLAIAQNPLRAITLPLATRLNREGFLNRPMLGVESWGHAAAKPDVTSRDTLTAQEYQQMQRHMEMY